MFEELLKQIDEFLPKDEKGNFIKEKEKSDVVHDVLAFLAEQMIELNKQKNKEIKGFLAWLESVHKIEIDKLSGKTIVKEYYKNDFDKIMEVFEKNRRLLGFNPKKRDFFEEAKGEYEKSVSKLRPLLERIKATDKLIDQMVYKLYGLTEEEVALVEGDEKL